MDRHVFPAGMVFVATVVALFLTSTAFGSVVGYQKISLGPGYNFVGISFKDTDEDQSFGIQTLFDTSELHGAMAQSGADQIYLWDADKQEYVELWLFDSGGSTPDYDGKWIDVASGGEVADQQIGLGDGFWYIRFPGADESVEVIVAGVVEEGVSSVHTAVAPQGDRSHSYNLFASAYPVDKPVNDMDWSGFTGGIVQGGADQLFLWDAQNQCYVELWLFESEGSYPDLDGKWIDVSTGDVAGNERTIAAGAAVWVLKQSGDDIEEQKPF